jgi:hypothetical protein
MGWKPCQSACAPLSKYSRPFEISYSSLSIRSRIAFFLGSIWRPLLSPNIAAEPSTWSNRHRDSRVNRTSWGQIPGANCQLRYTHSDIRHGSPKRLISPRPFGSPIGRPYLSREGSGLRRFSVPLLLTPLIHPFHVPPSSRALAVQPTCSSPEPHLVGPVQRVWRESLPTRPPR